MRKISFFAVIGNHTHKSEVFEYDNDATLEDLNVEINDWILDQIKEKGWIIEN